MMPLILAVYDPEGFLDISLATIAVLVVIPSSLVCFARVLLMESGRTEGSIPGTLVATFFGAVLALAVQWIGGILERVIGLPRSPLGAVSALVVADVIAGIMAAQLTTFPRRQRQVNVA